MNKSKLADQFVEIVAMRLDVYDQQQDGVWPPNTDYTRYKRRYLGMPKDDLPPHTIVMNNFKTEVDQFVAMLIRAVDDALDGHASDCATHNEPAYPKGECDCGKK